VLNACLKYQKNIKVGNLLVLRDSMADLGVDKKHEFKKTYFNALSWCSFCNKFIYGTQDEQGLLCNRCNCTVHIECEKSVSPYCNQVSPTLFKNNRALIQEGKAIHKQIAPKGSVHDMIPDTKPQDAALFLFNDSILICYEISEKEKEKIDKKTKVTNLNESVSSDVGYQLSTLIKWYSFSLDKKAEVREGPEGVNAINLICPRSLYTNYLEFPTPEEKASWQKQIEELISTYTLDISKKIEKKN